MDFGKIFGAVKTPLLIIIALDIVSIALMYLVYTSTASALEVSSNPLLVVSGLLGLIGLLVFIWAGYKVVKEISGTIVDAGIGAAMVAVISGLISGILNLLLITPLIVSKFPALLGADSAAVAAIAGVAGIIGLVIGLVIGAIIGFILGAIGGFVAKNTGAKK